MLQFSLTTRTPCPALPLYGTNLQLRLARLELTIYEDLLLGYHRRAMKCEAESRRYLLTRSLILRPLMAA